MSRDSIAAASATLAQLLGASLSPGPWRHADAYGGIIANGCTRGCDSWADHYGDVEDPPEWLRHPHNGYGGCLVVESVHKVDRDLIIALRAAGEHLPALLEAVAAEDPARVGQAARAIAAAVEGAD